MSEPESSENGYQRMRPRLPLWITIVSIVLAIASVSVLVLVLYEETKGPGEILREFARRVDRHDCEGSYDLLEESLKDQYPVENWCEEYLPGVDEVLDADFDLDRAVLRGDVAEVQTSDFTWVLRRYGERSWRVWHAPDTGVLPI